MEDRFRFLINVDQSIHLTSFDIFFYKLQHQRRLFIREVQLAEDETEQTLHNAVMSIRLYLDRYPYQLNDFEIIVTMRRLFTAGETTWRQSLLYRLLRLRHELRQARIFIASKEKKEKALTLVMLYDADFRAELPRLGDYTSGHRLTADLELLLRQLGIPEPRMIDRSSLIEALASARQALERSAGESLVGEAELRLLEEYLETHPEAEGQDESEFLDDDKEMQSCPKRQASPLFILLHTHLSEELTNAQVLERMIDRNDERSKILAQLRVAEYINASVVHDHADAESHSALPLSQRCRLSWDRIWADPELEQRYADMLSAYESNLREALRRLDELDFSKAEEGHRIPKPEIPKSQELSAEKGMLGLSAVKGDPRDPRTRLFQFKNQHLSPSNAVSQWEQVYLGLKQHLNELELNLKNYAQDLSTQYAKKLELRKQTVLRWKDGRYYADDDTPELRHTIEFKHANCIEQLQSPTMTPSLKFQDQLNMESALEQENRNIRFYLHCIQAINIGNFLLLLLVICGLALVHHTLMQYYVFQEATMMMAWLIYLGATVVLMLMTWYMPHAYFRRKVHQSVDRLIEQLELYINGFFRKAENFKVYMNLLNQQDYLNRYLRLIREAESNSSKRNHVRSWHTRKIQEHLTKLRYFSGLVELGRGDVGGERALRQRIDFSDMDMIKDEISTPIYWPQG